MGAVRYIQWRRAVAQVAVLLLLVQTVFGAGACLAKVRALTGAPDASGFFGAICTPYVAAPAQSGENGQPSGDVPAGAAKHDCTICLSFGSVIVTVDATPPGAPEGGPVFAAPPVTIPAGIPLSGYRNRGPPSSLSI
jgi:hypothetical protein